MIAGSNYILHPTFFIQQEETMKQSVPSNKMKQSLITVGILAALGTGAYFATTWQVGKQTDARLGRFVEEANAQIQKEDYLLVKPVIKLGEVKSSFFKTEFKLLVSVENIAKTQLATSLKQMEANLKSDAPYYTEEEVSETKAKIAAMPDVIEVMTINNHATHGPLPKISQFNLKPGLMSVESSTQFADLSPLIAEGIVTAATEQNIETLKNHKYLSANTFVSFEREFSTHVVSDKLSLKIPQVVGYDEKTEKAIETILNYNFDGLTLDLTAPRDLTNLDVALEFGKISVVSEDQTKKANLQFDGFNFAGQFTPNEILLGKSVLDIRPTKIEFSTEDNLVSTISVEGINSDFHRILTSNGDVDENISLTIKPVATNTFETNWYQDSPENNSFSMSNIAIKSVGKGIASDFYLKNDQMLKNDLRNLRTMILTGDSVSFMEETSKPEYFTRVLDLYRSIIGSYTVTVAPFDIKSETKTVGQQAVPTRLFATKIDTTTINFNRTSADKNDPLNVGIKIAGLDFDMQFFDELGEEDDDIKLSFKDAGISYGVPLHNLYPYSSQYTIGSLSITSPTLPNMNLTGLDFNSNFTPSNDTLGYFESYKIGNLQIKGLDFGGAEVKAHVSNLDKAGVDLIIANLKAGFDSYEKALTKPAESVDVYDFGGQPNLGIEVVSAFTKSGPEIFNTISSRGIESGISLISSGPNAGQVSANLDVKVVPLTLDKIMDFRPEDIPALIETVNFELDADVEQLIDSAARATLLVESPGNENVDMTNLESIKGMQRDMGLGVLSQPPFNLFLTQPTPEKLVSKITYSTGKFNINGKEMTLEELMRDFGL